MSVPNTELTREGLERDDLFTVVHEQFMTDTARYADVVLPATTQIEQLDVVASWGSLHLGINHPAIAPVGDSVSNTELFRRLAGAMGFTEPELIVSDEDLLATALGRRPTPSGQALHRDGRLRIDCRRSAAALRRRRFPDPASGKAELYSETPGRERATTHSRRYVPATEGPGGDPDLLARLPLVLLTPKTHMPDSSTRRTATCPAMATVKEATGSSWTRRCRVERGISDGDAVRVFNDRGCADATARIVDRLRPGVVAVPFGWWDADGGGRSANSLTNDEPDRLGRWQRVLRHSRPGRAGRALTRAITTRTGRLTSPGRRGARRGRPFRSRSSALRAHG